MIFKKNYIKNFNQVEEKSLRKKWTKHYFLRLICREEWFLLFHRVGIRGESIHSLLLFFYGINAKERGSLFLKYHPLRKSGHNHGNCCEFVG
tara:strand:+ start:300 stop:575 length:276 start_codon:yes stop_codon:yes gene_type:complete